MRTVHVLITGRVQGVWFRGWTRETATELGLDGWVRNRRGGAVEAVFSGEDAAVVQMLKACEQGPLYADVRDIEVVQEGGGVPTGFEIKPTV